MTLSQVKLTLWVASLTCMRFMASRIWSRWWAELSASRRMSVNFSSFSRSSFFSWRTISASASVHSHSLQSGLHTGRREVGASLRGEGGWRWSVTLTVMAAQRSAEARELSLGQRNLSFLRLFRRAAPTPFPPRMSKRFASQYSLTQYAIRSAQGIESFKFFSIQYFLACFLEHRMTRNYTVLQRQICIGVGISYEQSTRLQHQ